MRFVSLQSKDVINVYDGKKIGYIADIDYQRYQQGNLAKPVQYSLKSHRLLKKSHIQSE